MNSVRNISEWGRMKRVQYGLSLVGGMVALVGAVLLSAVSIPRFLHELPSEQPEAVYAATDGCYTCHIDADSLWSDDLTPRVIEDAVINPHAATITDALPIGEDGDSLAYRVAGVEISMSPNYRFGTYQGSLP